MAAQFPDDMRRGGLDPSELLSETPAHTAALKPIATQIFTRWAALL